MSNSLDVLQRIAANRAPRPATERCEMCGAEAGSDHSHVVDVQSRSLMCTCRPCYLLFTQGDAELRYRSVPDRYAAVLDLEVSPGQWDDLAIPVNVAFLFSHSTLGRMVAFYPSPAGATESELPLDAWLDIQRANPMLTSLRDDVEAVLLRRVGELTDCYIVPVDVCYELVGQLRLLWRGFDGGEEVRRRIEDFFDIVAARCRYERGSTS
jgi:hypothetical protein